MTAFGGQRTAFDQAVQSFNAGDLDAADAICERLLQHNRRDANALMLRCRIAIQAQDFDAAARHAAGCVALRPGEAQPHFLAGLAASLKGDYADAVGKLDEALALEPGNAEASEWKAVVLEWDGDHEGARAVLEPFVAAGRETPRMAETQARIDIRAARWREAADIARRHLARSDLPPDARARLGQVAGEALERLGDYDESFAAHADANRAVAVPFDEADYARFIGRVLDVFSADRVAELARHGDRSELPVFIAGMPRSGTTLVEQIIDAHPKALGAGEINDIEAAVGGLQVELQSTEPYPECVADLEPDDVARLAGRYLDRLRALAPSARRVVNKSLANYRTLGFVALLFPAARVIVCRRDPRDTCVSCYMSTILPQALPYITDLRHLGFAYRQHERLLAHWKKVLTLPMLEVDYEAVVDDLEAQSRRIIEFCGLDWDDRCLRFHASGRTVRTMSYEQVRRPIYRSSIGRYKRFERHLGPLLEALAAGSG
jgi:tetratricopeptide (TPR) repeat protein